MRAIVLALPLVLFAGSAIPAASIKSVAIYGLGNISCGTWSDDRQNDHVRANQDLSWVLGFVSAQNIEHHVNVADGTDADGMAAWLDRYCVKHPSDPLFFAVQSMVPALLDRQVVVIQKKLRDIQTSHR